jgi:RNA polymerase sigma factor (TIGR02999 family)
MDAPRSVTELLHGWSQGENDALELLAPRVERELRVIARSHLRGAGGDQTLQATALINEAYIRLIDRSQPVQWESRAHFFGIAARLMRHVLVDYARARRAEKRGGGAEAITLDETRVLSTGGTANVIEVHEALSEFEKVDSRKARVIEMRYFGGLSREEVATALGLTLATVKRDLRLGEAWLKRYLSSEDPGAAR